MATPAPVVPAVEPTPTPQAPVPPPQGAAPTPAPQEPHWWEITDSEPVAPPAAPQAPQAPAYFLRADTGTVYKTPEEAARGVAEKDRVIAQQKADLQRYQQMLAASGVQVGASSAPPTAPPLVAALRTAVEKGDMTFDQAMAAMIEQQTQSQLQPLLPLVEHVTMSRAVEQAGMTYDPNIPAFFRSPAYNKALESRPALKTAIQNAAAYPYHQTPDGRTFADLLPELLSTVYLVAKATAPAATTQRPAPTTTTPPQMTRTGAPQAPGTTGLPGALRDPFAEAWSEVPDVPLTGFRGSSTLPF